MTCACGLGESTETCCLPIIKGERPAPTAEMLMRTRYSAYVLGEVDYILGTLHPEASNDVDREGTEKWSREAEWLGLEVVSTQKGAEEDEAGVVEFIARFRMDGVDREHHEQAQFARHRGRWYYLDGRLVPHKPIVRDTPRVGRNDPCVCGSGKKYKKCCG